MNRCAICDCYPPLSILPADSIERIRRTPRWRASILHSWDFICLADLEWAARIAGLIQ